MNKLKNILLMLWRMLKSLLSFVLGVIRSFFVWLLLLPVRYWQFLRTRTWPARIFSVVAIVTVAFIIVQLSHVRVPAYLLTQTGEPVAYPQLSRLVHMAPRPPSAESKAALDMVCKIASDCGDALAACRNANALRSDRTCIELTNTCSNSRNACSAGPEHTFQGWTERDRNTYYYTSQGSAQVMFGNMRYDWFAELEKPFSTEKFASPANMYRFGFLISPGQTANPTWNPGNLPVGFTRYYDPEVKAELLDVTCSLCHTGELHYTDPKDPRSVTALRVDGGQAMHAVTSMQIGQFQAQMVQSLLATWISPWKFNRFAENVFNRRQGITDSSASPNFKEHRDALRDKFGEMIHKLLKQAIFETSNGIYPVLEGYGRIDAVQRIANTVFGRGIDPVNYKPGVAPVSYPHTWDISKFDWVQYEGYASQPMARNVNEALGVGARLDLFDDIGLPLPKHERFRTSVDPKRLHEIETTLARLTAPAWPESLFGAPDTKLASKGRALFDTHCRDCHGPHRTPAFPSPDKQHQSDPNLAADLQYKTDPVTNEKYCQLNGERIGDQACIHLQNPQRIADADGKPMFKLDKNGVITGVCSEDDASCGTPPDEVEEWRIFTLPLVAIGTDPTAATNLANQRYDGSRLELTAQDLRDVCVSEELIESMDVTSLNAIQGLNLLSLSIANKYFEDNPPSSPQEMLKLMGFGILDYPLYGHHQLEGYKPRPLHGIWATPPFLHNGSVRTVYQLLSPVEEREPEFWVGTKEYDPEVLGYRSLNIPGAILQKASVIGNGNDGHEFRTGCDKYGVIGPYLHPDERMAIIEYLKVMDYVDDGALEPVLDQSIVDAEASELSARFPGYGTPAFYDGWQGHCSYENPVYKAPPRPQLVSNDIYSDRHKSTSCSLYKLYLEQESGNE
ncbi:MAG: di-heme-cytochrome C peroxidase [Halioglobus sp.]